MMASCCCVGRNETFYPVTQPEHIAVSAATATIRMEGPPTFYIIGRHIQQPDGVGKGRTVYLFSPTCTKPTAIVNDPKNPRRLGAPEGEQQEIKDEALKVTAARNFVPRPRARSLAVRLKTGLPPRRFS